MPRGVPHDKPWNRKRSGPSQRFRLFAGRQGKTVFVAAYSTKSDAETALAAYAAENSDRDILFWQSAARIMPNAKWRDLGIRKP